MTFIAGPGGLEFALEADERGGCLPEGGDALSRFAVGHHEAHDRGWTAEMDSRMG
ncbi:hypothetical protein [Streptomyces sp. NPDC057428]|uniref:hypothetical protein n=1 Tax=Streptomyces sp. NPDC057428 TaxID=3346129 RepID=UPI00367B08D0